MDLEQKAREFATNAHRGQYRKGGNHLPYITHPEMVVELLKKSGTIESDIICSGWLHDTMEDCGVTIETIKQEFNPNIARIVDNLTRNCSREEYKQRIKTADISVKLVKIADVVHNCQTLEDGIKEKTILNKVKDCKDFYLDLARETSPYLHQLMFEAISPWIKRYEGLPK